VYSLDGHWPPRFSVLRLDGYLSICWFFASDGGKIFFYRMMVLAPPGGGGELGLAVAGGEDWCF
jgi:hypothetical protein